MCLLFLLTVFESGIPYATILTLPRREADNLEKLDIYITELPKEEQNEEEAIEWLLISITIYQKL